MATDPLQMNLGSLRSVMSLTLHTYHAVRIWAGRVHTDSRTTIPGLLGFLQIMSRMKRAAAQDDPYADWWMLRMEDKLAKAKVRMQALQQQAEQVLAGIPCELSVSESLNVQPLKLPLRADAQLGFAAIYLLTDYDKLARQLLLAHHTALLDRTTLELWLYDGANALRGLFFLAARFEPSGATRGDFAAGSPAAQAALERFGALPPEVMDGTRRSGFAPPMRPLAPTTNTPAAEAVGGRPLEPSTAAPTSVDAAADDDELPPDEGDLE